jgi:hypothetical protein
MEPAATLPETFDPTREAIDLLPLRAWEVAKVRAQLAQLQSEPPGSTREARTVRTNVIEAHRAALAEYAASGWWARLRRGQRRLAAIRSHRPREIGGLRVLPGKKG